MGKIALKLEEIDRLTLVLADAVLYFDVHIEDELLQHYDLPDPVEEVAEEDEPDRFNSSTDDESSDVQSQCLDDLEPITSIILDLYNGPESEAEDEQSAP